MVPSGTVLLHDSSAARGRSLLFREPARVLTTCAAAEASDLLAEAEAALAAGHHLAGFLSYDLGLGFEERLAPLLPARSSQPLLWLGLFGPPEELDADAASEWLADHAGDAGARIDDLQLGATRANYEEAFRRVSEYIHAGDVYQVNLTFPARFRLQGDAAALYRELCARQPVAHGALVNTGEHTVLSLSPELFVERQGARIVTRPMKGTIRRGRTPAEDTALRHHLAEDEKSRAENLMIVDLLRNDVGRVAETGSVEVEHLFAVETYETLHQMTSTVSGVLRPGVRFGEILRALFPCGSVTGAPKIRAMEIIAEVERGTRGLYCGSVGFAAPSGDFSFNVAIRTAVIRNEDGAGEIGIGGGVVADSTAEAEYDEALLKLRFLREPHQPFGLIETLRWDERGFHLLDRHLDRLGTSAAFFEIPCDLAKARDVLDEAVQEKRPPLRVRLLLDERGSLSVGTTPLAPMERLRFVVSSERTLSSDPLLAHKTTRRAFYDSQREAAAEEFGADEVVFINERGELTEGSFTSIFVESGGVLLTPPLECGLLPGTLRAELIASSQAREAVLTPGDLGSAEAVFLGNSVRGLLPATALSQETRGAVGKGGGVFGS